MKYYWIGSTINIKTKDIKNTLCASKMREGNMPLNNVNVGKEFLPIQKYAFRQQAFPNFGYWCWLSTATMLNKVRFLMSALS